MERLLLCSSSKEAGGEYLDDVRWGLQLGCVPSSVYSCGTWDTLNNVEWYERTGILVVFFVRFLEGESHRDLGTWLLV